MKNEFKDTYTEHLAWVHCPNDAMAHITIYCRYRYMQIEYYWGKNNCDKFKREGLSVLSLTENVSNVILIVC